MLRKVRYVSWVDNAAFRGFRVQIPKRGLQRYFGVATYGTKTNAHAAAVAYAEAHAPEPLPKPGPGRIQHGKGRGVAKTLGVTRSREHWVATWYDPAYTRHRIYCGRGKTGLARATAIRAEAEALLAARRSTKALLKRATAAMAAALADDRLDRRRRRQAVLAQYLTD